MRLRPERKNVFGLIHRAHTCSAGDLFAEWLRQLAIKEIAAASIHFKIVLVLLRS